MFSSPHYRTALIDIKVNGGLKDWGLSTLHRLVSLKTRSQGSVVVNSSWTMPMCLIL